MLLEARVDYTLGEDTFVQVDFSADLAGLVIGVNGPSGSGKTSFFNILCGLRRPYSGEIILDGRVLYDSRRGISVPAHDRRIGMVFQDYRLFPHMSVRGNLMYGYDPENTDLDPDSLAEILEITPLLKRKPRFLSGGEKQRVALGRALLAGPGLLLLDEPFSALDDRLRRRSSEWLCGISRELGIPLIMVSHNSDDLRHAADLHLNFGSHQVSGPHKLDLPCLKNYS